MVIPSDNVHTQFQSNKIFQIILAFPVDLTNFQIHAHLIFISVNYSEMLLSIIDYQFDSLRVCKYISMQ